MAVDFSLACSLSLSVFALYAYFSLFRPDVVHTAFCFLAFPFVLALKVLLSETVTLPHRYSGLRVRRLSSRKRQQGYSTTPLLSVHCLVLHCPRVSSDERAK